MESRKSVHKEKMEYSVKHDDEMAYNTTISIIMAEWNIDELAEEYSNEIASSITTFIDVLSKGILDDIITSMVL